MSQYVQEFVELHRLLEKKLGELKETYKIETDGIPSAYDILNSQKVDDILTARRKSLARLRPGSVDPTVLHGRFIVAYNIVKNERLQYENPDLCAVVQTALEVARKILQAGRKEAAYAAWHATQQRTEADAEIDRQLRDIEAARKREARERKKLEKELADARRRAEEEAEARRQAERAAEASRELQDEDGKEPAESPSWLNLGLNLLERFIQRQAEAQREEPPLDVTGWWQGSDTFLYYMEHRGNAVRLQAVDSVYRTPVVVGEGQLFGRRMNFSGRSLLDGSWGTASAEVSADGRYMTATFTNHLTGMSGIVYLRR